MYLCWISILLHLKEPVGRRSTEGCMDSDIMHMLQSGQGHFRDGTAQQEDVWQCSDIFLPMAKVLSILRLWSVSWCAVTHLRGFRFVTLLDLSRNSSGWLRIQMYEHAAWLRGLVRWRGLYNPFRSLNGPWLSPMMEKLNRHCTVGLVPYRISGKSTVRCMPYSILLRICVCVRR